ncbi:MAG: hypothetical protein AB8B74_13205 [Crocinitomicaceae bacterium]
MGLKDRFKGGVKSIVRKRLLFEFLSVFFAVVSAYGLKNWYDYKRDAFSEEKILMEINKGLSKDLFDIKSNVRGHDGGLRACKVFNKIIQGFNYEGDSLGDYYSNLTRDFINAQNIAGYTTLKSKGLELVDNDRLRQEIISIYEYDYNTLRKFEEEYEEMQFHKSYFNTLNNILAPNFVFSSSGKIEAIKYPLQISESDRNIVRSVILKIYTNRLFIKQYYKQLEYKLKHLRISIESELGE